MKRISFLMLLLLGMTCGLSAQQVQEAYAVEMSGANNENMASLRPITYSYNEESKVYTYYGLLEDECEVQFHIANQNTNNNITFDNGTEAEESPFTWYLPGKNGNGVLVAVFSHQDYTNADLRSFQTCYNEKKQEGYLVVLNGKRNSIARVVRFGAGKLGEEIIEEVANIADFKAKAQSSKLNLGYNTPASIYRIAGPVTCIVDYATDVTWYYVQDATGTLGIYTNHSFPLGTKNYKAGDVLEGITGYSVGSASDGYYMDLEAERFYVYDADSVENEHTLFPAASGRIDVLAPMIITSKSEVNRTMNHDYVCLKDFTFVASKTEDKVNTLNCLKDASGAYFELSFDYVTIPPTDKTSEARITFLEQVSDGYKGTFIGFLSNNCKNFMVTDWCNNQEDEIKSVNDNQYSATRRRNNTYNLQGQRAEANGKGLLIQNGKKMLRK